MKNIKQEIISIIDEMDEDSIDWMLNLLKRRPKKEVIFKYSTDPDIKEIWGKVCELIKLELTEVSYNTWIRNITPIEIKDDVLKLGVSNEFNKNILEGRYGKLISNVLFYVTDRRFELEYIVLGKK